MIERYEIKEINEIFSDQSKYEVWLLIELLVLEYYAKINKISSDDFNHLKNSLKIDIHKINELEKKAKHDVIAFVESLNYCTNNDCKKWIHFGLTSTDIVDTANAVLLKKANQIILNSLNELLKTIKKLAYKHKHTYLMGRTHGIHAELTTFGLKMALWYDELLRDKKRFVYACADVEVGKISGAVGTFANTGTKLQDFVCKKLKINSANISTQIIQRDNHAHYFSVINLIGLSINKFASELRHMARTEVNEINEFFDLYQKGSSAMPHKKNPVNLENVCGLSRLLSGYNLTINENVNLWHERDISHSSNERIIFLDGLTIIINILNKMNLILQKMVVNKNQMKKNIGLTKKCFFSQTLLLKLVECSHFSSRQQIYELVQSLAFKAVKENLDFEKLLLESEIVQYLNVNQIKEVFDLKYHTKYIDSIYKRVFNHGK